MNTSVAQLAEVRQGPAVEAPRYGKSIGIDHIPFSGQHEEVLLYITTFPLARANDVMELGQEGIRNIRKSIIKIC
jgi:hypothetical protein